MGVHVKDEHGSNLAKWGKKHTSTNIQYECQFCGSQVTHEKEAIASHVDTHFLTLEVYGRMYEKKRIKELEKERTEDKERKDTTVKVLSKSEEKCNDLDELNESLMRFAKKKV